MIFKQFYLPCLAHASYLIGDEATGTAAVVDPQRDIEIISPLPSEHGLKIKHVFLTHLHADFVAGHLELRDRAGANLSGRRAQAEYRFTPLADGSVVEFGRVRLKALETPGHTPESVSLLVFDLDQSETEPYAVLTGDTLFIGDVGRPDLRAALVGPPAISAGCFSILCTPNCFGAAGRKPRVSGSWRGLALRQSHQQGNRIHHGRAAPRQLRAAAHEQGSFHPASSPPISRKRQPTSSTTPC